MTTREKTEYRGQSQEEEELQHGAEHQSSDKKQASGNNVNDFSPGENKTAFGDEKLDSRLEKFNNFMDFRKENGASSYALGENLFNKDEEKLKESVRDIAAAYRSSFDKEEGYPQSGTERYERIEMAKYITESITHPIWEKISAKDALESRILSQDQYDLMDHYGVKDLKYDKTTGTVNFRTKNEDIAKYIAGHDSFSEHGATYGKAALQTINDIEKLEKMQNSFIRTLYKTGENPEKEDYGKTNDKLNAIAEQMQELWAKYNNHGIDEKEEETEAADPRTEHPITYESVMENLEGQARHETAKQAMDSNWEQIEEVLEDMEKSIDASGINGAMNHIRGFMLRDLKTMFENEDVPPTKEEYTALMETAEQEAGSFLAALNTNESVLINEPAIETGLDHTKVIPEKDPDIDDITIEAAKFQKDTEDVVQKLKDANASTDSLAWRAMEASSDELDYMVGTLTSLNEANEDGSMDYEVNKMIHKLDAVMMEIEFLLKPAEQAKMIENENQKAA